MKKIPLVVGMIMLILLVNVKIDAGSEETLMPQILAEPVMTKAQLIDNYIIESIPYNVTSINWSRDNGSTVAINMIAEANIVCKLSDTEKLVNAVIKQSFSAYVTPDCKVLSDICIKGRSTARLFGDANLDGEFRLRIQGEGSMVGEAPHPEGIMATLNLTSRGGAHNSLVLNLRLGLRVVDGELAVEQLEGSGILNIIRDSE